MGCTYSSRVLPKPPVITAVSESASELGDVDETLEQAIQWMLAKGVLASNEAVRKAHVVGIRDKSNKNDDGVRQRLLRLTSGRDVHHDDLPNELHKFTTDEFPHYEHIHMVHDPQTCVQRVQRSGLCYMNAPAVVQYYAVWHHSRTVEHKMLDIATDIRTHFDAKALQKHIFNDEGGDSWSHLDRILQPGSEILDVGRSEAARCLSEYGPGLVARFVVHRDFFDNRAMHHHYGAPQGKVVGLHAMVLVGFRQEGERSFFLLQNWWKDKQFVELDEVYLAACKPRFSFVVTPQSGVPCTFPTVTGHYFETEMLDKPEGLGGEMET